MKESKGWVQGLILVLIISLSGVIFGGTQTMENKPPIPARVVAEDGTPLFTARDITGGQAVFEKYGLMDYGSVFGHGAYLGPDYTAQYLHRSVLAQADFYAAQSGAGGLAALDAAKQAAVQARVRKEQKDNRYDPNTDTLRFTAAQTAAYQRLKADYVRLFQQGNPAEGIPVAITEKAHDPADNWLSAKPQAEQLVDFFAWTAWAAAANRPGLDYSYTNNWPSDDLAGNYPTRSVVVWSTASIGFLMAGLGLILYLYRRFNLHASGDELGYQQLPGVESFSLTPSQLKTAKYFLVVGALFLLQVLVGALSAHYFVEKNFFGLPIQNLLPFNISRAWHLQLAVFWVATAWLGTGIFVAPLVGGREPKAQGLLVDVLFGAVVVVALGSLAGEWLGSRGYLGKLWFWLGDQGWEYLELGRLWQVLLLVGMTIWLFIVYRALRYRLVREPGRSSLSHLLLYSAITIPAFYAFGLFYDPSTNFTVADFWRWFVVHQWVEAIFEFFTVVVISFLFVSLGLVTERSATRAVYFTLMLVFGTGLIGVGHHYYFTGAPAIWLALGATFSALEVIPLTVLVFDVAEQARVLQRAGVKFQYQAPLKFLVATSVWNFVGAGILGFIANLPIINYYEHGTYLTPTHGHASMMGTYGMLAIGLLLFSLRTIVRPEHWPERLVNWSFWLINIGLAGMVFTSLLPIGFAQLSASFAHGTWFARSFDFINSPLVQTLIWARMPSDVLFILGALLLVVSIVKGVLHLRPAQAAATSPAKASRAATY